MPIIFKGQPVLFPNVADIYLDLNNPLTYAKFQKKYRLLLGNGFSHNLPVARESKGGAIKVLISVGIKYADSEVVFAVRKSDGFIVDFRTSKKVWWELNEKGKKLGYIADSGDLKLGVNYGEWMARSGLGIYDCKFSREIMQKAVSKLANFRGKMKKGKPLHGKMNGASCAALLRCTLFLAEGARFLPVEKVLHRGLYPKTTVVLALVHEMLLKMKFKNSVACDIVHNWAKFSSPFVDADGNCGSPADGETAVDMRLLPLFGLLKG